MFSQLPQLKSKNVLYVDYVDIVTAENLYISNLLNKLFDKVIYTNQDEHALLLYKEEAPDLIVIDVNLPAINGVSLIRRFRSLNYHIPIIIVTSRHKHAMLVEIANLSVDAFLFKPLDDKIFADALSRSLKRNFHPRQIVNLSKNLSFNLETKELHLNDKLVTLGVKENQLLLLLINNMDKTITKNELAYSLWPSETPSDTTIRKLINRLRKKLHSDLIVSVRSIGYKLDVKNLITTQECQHSA